MTANYMRTYNQRRMAPVVPTATCVFIAGEKPYGPAPYCDAPVQEGSSYCPDHHRVCRVPLDPHIALRWIRWAEFGGRER